MLKSVAVFLASLFLCAAIFAADPPAKSDTAEVRRAKQQFAAQQESKKKSARTQKKWAKSQKKGYNKAVKARRKSSKPVKSAKKGNVKPATTRAVNR